MQPIADVAVVGAGIVGLAIARELALAGARVRIFDRGEPGREASSAAAGMLAPQAECDAPRPLFALGMASRALYPATVEALREETGLDPELDGEGIVYLALDDAEVAVLERRATWQARAGFSVERLSGREVRSVEPELAATVRMALRFPDDLRIDNVRLTHAYAIAAVRAGVEIRPGTPVMAVRSARGRATGVETAAGAVSAGIVVAAAGAWAAQLGGVSTMPVEPVRGHMVLVHTPRTIVRHAIYRHGVYLVPRRDGRLLVGSTYEHAGFDKRVTAHAVQHVLAGGLRVLPALGDTTVVDAWAGLRPGTPDGLPIIGADPLIAGLFHATGHYRNGILLAPVTARAVHALVAGVAPQDDIEPFSPARVATPTSQGRREGVARRHGAGA